MVEPEGGLFSLANVRFTLFESPSKPRWRSPQRGALGALLTHWSLPRTTPALISLPTGTGKSAIAVAAPLLVGARRVLAVVPSTELRRQLVRAFKDLAVLRDIGAVDGVYALRVHELKNRVHDWQELLDFEVVVASPATISPVHYPEAPPSDLFDLVIIDEAHHSPAPTWRAILDHFSEARAVLLTATPRRADGQRVPGEHVYHYPLRQALEERIFKPVRPVLLESLGGQLRSEADRLILTAVAEIASTEDHKTSTLMARASSKERATELAALYRAAGFNIEVLHSDIPAQRRRQITDDLRSGRLRAVSVVGMLIEGFDLPSLRLLAYHDKHKSLPATAQLIGRLARVDDRFPQPSVLVTVKDIDVYPELQGIVRTLYDEDPDWATILPGVIDDDIEAQRLNYAYARQFQAAPPDLSVESIQPLRRTVIYELAKTSAGTTPLEGGVPEGLHGGKPLRGTTVLYSSLNPSETTLVVVTESINRPSWYDAPDLDTAEYQLHILSRRNSPRTDLPDLLFLNVEDYGVGAEILDLVDAKTQSQLADPGRLHAAFDSLERISVSSVGLRNDYGGSTGTASYRSYAGKGVDRGLREADTAYGSLGHAMIQISDDEGSCTVGVATAKGKYWETRYSSLLKYDAFLDQLAERYWFPPSAATGQLLPQVNRGSRLSHWPDALPIAVELDPALIGMGWLIDEVGPLDSLDFEADPHTGGGRLDFRAIARSEDDSRVAWTGQLDLLGNVEPSGPDLIARRGYGVSRPLSELLTDRAPTIFFGNGDTVHSTVIVSSRTRIKSLPMMDYRRRRWPDVDIRAETKKQASNRGKGRSIHEELENYLIGLPRLGRHRWVIHNDGGGEFADYIVIEVDHESVFVGLWHAKYAGADFAAARVTDLQEVIAQAIKSRRWITDPGFWEELGKRLTGKSSPRASIVDGRKQPLLTLCGQAERAESLSFCRKRPLVKGTVAVVQPGLSYLKLRSGLDDDILTAVQIRDLIAVFHDSVSQVASPVIMCSD